MAAAGGISGVGFQMHRLKQLGGGATGALGSIPGTGHIGAGRRKLGLKSGSAFGSSKSGGSVKKPGKNAPPWKKTSGASGKGGKPPKKPKKPKGSPGKKPAKNSGPKKKPAAKSTTPAATTATTSTSSSSGQGASPKPKKSTTTAGNKKTKKGPGFSTGKKGRGRGKGKGRGVGGKKGRGKAGGGVKGGRVGKKRGTTTTTRKKKDGSPGSWLDSSRDWYSGASNSNSGRSPSYRSAQNGIDLVQRSLKSRKPLSAIAAEKRLAATLRRLKEGREKARWRNLQGWRPRMVHTQAFGTGRGKGKKGKGKGKGKGKKGKKGKKSTAVKKKAAPRRMDLFG